MASACGLSKSERVVRLIIGAGGIAVGVARFRADKFVAIVLGGWGSATVVAAALGH